MTPFRCAIRAVALSNLLKPTSCGSNCDRDDDHLLADVLFNAARADGSRSAALANAAASKHLGEEVSEDLQERWASEDEEDVVDEDAEHHILTRPEEEVVDLLGGYVVCHLASKMKCSACCDALLSSRQGLLVSHRQYKDCHNKAMRSSSPSLRCLLKHAEFHIRKQLAEAPHEDGVSASIRRHMASGCPVLDCCHPVDSAATVLKLYLRTRLHHFSRLHNQQLMDCKSATKKIQKL